MSLLEPSRVPFIFLPFLTKVRKESSKIFFQFLNSYNEANIIRLALRARELPLSSPLTTF